MHIILYFLLDARYLIHMRTKLHKDKHEQVLKMRASGLTYKEIGDFFGLTKERVRQILDVYGKAGRKKKSTVG